MPINPLSTGFMAWYNLICAKHRDFKMKKNIIRTLIALLASFICSACVEKQSEQSPYAHIPTPQDGLDIRYFKKRLDTNNTNDHIDYIAIVYNEKNLRREEVMLYYSSKHKTIEKIRKSYYLASEGEITMFENAYDTVGRPYLSITTGTTVVYSTEPKSPGYIPITNSHTLQGTRRIKLEGMKDSTQVFSFYTPYTYVHEEYYDTLLKLVKFSECYFDMDFSMEQTDDINVPEHFRSLIINHHLEKDDTEIDSCMSTPYFNQMEKEVLLTDLDWKAFIRIIMKKDNQSCIEQNGKAFNDYLKGNEYRNSLLTAALFYHNEENRERIVERLLSIMQSDSTFSYNNPAQLSEDFLFLKNFPAFKNYISQKELEK